jgi:hypothetical protein
MLVHMAPEEVQGLHRLALSQGTQLTINPHTGLVEAWSLKKFFKSAAAPILGAALSFIPGVGPFMAAGIVGGLTGLASGSLEKGLAAGLGAYGGAGIAQGLSGAAAAGAATPAGPSALQASGTTAGGAQAAFGDTARNSFDLADDAFQAGKASGAIPAGAAANPVMTGAGFALPPGIPGASGPATFGSNADKAGAGLKNMASGNGLDKFVAAQGGAGAAMRNAVWGLAPVLAGQQDTPGQESTAQDPGMIRPSTFDVKTRMFTSGNPYPASEAKNRFTYAEGGLADLAGVSADTRMNKGYDFDVGSRMFSRSAPPVAATPSNVTQYLDPGESTNYGGGSGGPGGGSTSSGQNADGSPNSGVSTNSGLSGLGLNGIADAIGVAIGQVANALSAPNEAPAPVESMGTAAVGNESMSDAAAAATAAADGMSDSSGIGADGSGIGGVGDGVGGVGVGGDAGGSGTDGGDGGSGTGGDGTGGYAPGGLAALARSRRKAAGGRFLRGPGDGVSDSIPAKVDGSGQQARLADGEFVVPARIVSELGNGSSEAGARALYAMMDRIQQRRAVTAGPGRVAVDSRARAALPA